MNGGYTMTDTSCENRFGNQRNDFMCSTKHVFYFRSAILAERTGWISCLSIMAWNFSAKIKIFLKIRLY
jgi:hypothetical protein